MAAGSHWNSFPVNPGVDLTGGETYRIYMTRSTLVDSISWRSCSAGDDEYPYGISSGAAGVDFLFRVYDNGVVDQSQEVYGYGYAIYDTSYQWQEFIAGRE